MVDHELRSESFHPDFLEYYPDAAESIHVLLVFVGSTPVLWHSKRLGCIATSAKCAELISMRTAVDEAISIRYICYDVWEYR